MKRVHMLAPAPRQRSWSWLVTASMGVWAALVFVGIYSSFYLSAAWKLPSLFATAAVALGPIAWIAILIHRATSSNPRLGGPFWPRFMGWVVVPGIIFGSFWVVIGSGIPDIYTRIVGRPFRQTEILRTEFRSSIRCHHRVVGGSFADSWTNSYFCVSERTYLRLPDSGPMTYGGRETWFGRQVDWIVAAPPGRPGS